MAFKKNWIQAVSGRIASFDEAACRRPTVQRNCGMIPWVPVFKWRGSLTGR